MLCLPSPESQSAVMTAVQINVSSASPSTNFRMLHLRSYHACANSKLISHRRHLPVLHSGPNRGKPPGTDTLTDVSPPHDLPAPKESQPPDARRRPGSTSSQNLLPCTINTPIDFCRMRLTRSSPTDAAPWQRCLRNAVKAAHVIADDLGPRRTYLPLNQSQSICAQQLS